MALPLQDGVELLDVVQAGEDGVVAQGIELLLAEIIGAALHDRDLQRAEQRFKEGDVLEGELLLQVFCTGGDDHAPVCLACVLQRGQEIGQGLAGAGAGFDDEVAAVFEGLFNSLGHGNLAGALLEVERGAGKEAARGEEVMEAGELGVVAGFAEGRLAGLLSRAELAGGWHGGLSL